VKSPAQQILAATDFSDSAEAALAVAVQSARALRAGLHVLHVFAAGETDVTQLLADAVAKAAPDVHEPCRARIRGEALEHKQREERAGRT
jgi:nucleotide-binding universal stress UspA family protein